MEAGLNEGKFAKPRRRRFWLHPALYLPKLTEVSLSLALQWTPPVKQAGLHVKDPPLPVAK